MGAHGAPLQRNRFYLHNAGVARVWVGTSGFSYREWKGTFYPDNLTSNEFLRYYASRFTSVEIDSTFYRMPTSKALETWRNETPEAFRFTLKASQRITHRERLRVPSEALQYFTQTAATLKDRLGLVLYQLPPFFKYEAERLKAFLEVLPSDIHACMEFRHPSWFTSEVYLLLEKHKVALCIHDGDDGCSPLQITAARTCVRLRQAHYSEEAREQWRERWRDWSKSGLDVFAYIKHKDNPNAPQIALDFARGF